MDYFYETIKMLKNRNYKIIFKHAEKSKYGTESFIYNSGRGINKDIYIKDIKDFYGEKRKKKKVIGTTLVNLINALPAIEKNIKNCLAETRSFNFNKVEEFYQKAFFIIDKSNICNLANIEEYHLLINEFLQKQIKLNGLDFDEINALKKFISQASDNEIISVCEDVALENI